MKNRIALYELISKLSKSEKRAFKLYINKYQSANGKKIAKLFDSIVKKPAYNKKSLLKITDEKQLNYDLNRLHNHLMDAMTDFHFKSSSSNNMGGIINRIELGFKYNIDDIVKLYLKKDISLWKMNQIHHFIFNY